MDKVNLLQNSIIWLTETQHEICETKHESLYDKIIVCADKKGIAISRRLFAKRLVPLHILGSFQAGQDSICSASHWLDLLSFWSENGPSFYSNPISIQDLHRLRFVLQEYRNILNRCYFTYDCQNKNDNDVSNQGSQSLSSEILKQIQNLKKGSCCYIPLGYAAEKGGQAIALKCVNKGEYVDLICLNLAEGMRYHPILDCGLGTEKFHFQSFPVRCNKNDLSKPFALDIFTRLINLMQVCEEDKNTRYSIEDIYGLLGKLGTTQNAFSDSVEKRARQSQKNAISGDVAVALIIEDSLIDLGYKKEQIERFFIIEKIFCIFCFYENIKTNKLIDDWILLKSGLQALANEIVHAKVETLSFLEKSHCEKELERIESAAQKGIDKLRVVTLPNLFSDKVSGLTYFHTDKVKHITKAGSTRKFSLAHQSLNMQSRSIELPETLSFRPTESAKVFFHWASVARQLCEAGEQERAALFIYNAFLALEFPEHGQKDFWDDVPEMLISKTIENLCHALYWGSQVSLYFGDTPKNCDYVIPRYALTFSSAYAIADKLLRRKYPMYFKDFISPFLRPCENDDYIFFTESDAKESGFMFLPFKNANERWTKIRAYFEKGQKEGKYFLFAVGYGKIPCGALPNNLLQSNKNNSCFAGNILYPLVNEIDQHFIFLSQFFDSVFKEEKKLSVSDKLFYLSECLEGGADKVNSGLFNSDIDIILDIHPLQALAFLTQSIICNGFLNVSAHGINFNIVSKCTNDEDKNVVRLRSIFTSPSKWLGAHRYSEFIEQWFHAGRSMGENQACVVQLKKWLANDGLQEKAIRAFLRSFATPSLQIPSLILWIEDNLSILNREDIQNLLFCALFQPGCLIQAIDNDIDILENATKVIKSSIEFYIESEFEFSTVLFLINLGICFETYNPKIAYKTLEYYEKILIKLIVKNNVPELYRSLSLLYRLHLPQTEISRSFLVLAHFRLKFGLEEEKGYQWMSVEGGFTIDSYLNKLKEWAHNEKWSDQLFNQIFAALFPKEPLPEGICSLDYPLLKKGDYVFHLENAAVSKNGYSLCILQETTKKVRLWCKEGRFLTEDYEEEYTLRTTSLATASRYFPTLDKQATWCKVKEKYLLEKEVVLFSRPRFFTYWKSDSSIIICKSSRSHDYVPYAIASFLKEHVYEIRRAGTQELLINIWSEEENPYARWAKRLQCRDEICIWKDEKSGNVSRIEFLELELEFVAEPVDLQEELIEKDSIKPTWRMRCTQFPDFVLAPEQALEELNYYEGAIILCNEQKKAALIPTRLFNVDQSLFGKYIFFECNPLTSKLISSSTQANLLLTFLFATKKDYPKALFYLSKTKCFSYLKKHYASLFWANLGVIDQSPEAMAFYIRMGLNILENKNQILFESYTISKENENKDIEEKPRIDPFDTSVIAGLAFCYEKYLYGLDVKGHNAIPQYLILSLEDEKFLLCTIKKAIHELMNEGKKHVNFEKWKMFVPSYLQNNICKLFWNEVFERRLELITNKTVSIDLLPSYYPLAHEYDISLSITAMFIALGENINHFFKINEPGLENVPCKDHIIRLTVSELKQQFINLYNKAKKQEASIDIFFIIRSSKLLNLSSFASFIISMPSGYACYNDINQIISQNPHSVSDLITNNKDQWDSAMIYACYGGLLRYVQKNPNSFKKLEFCEDVEKNRDVFEKIVKKYTKKINKIFQNIEVIIKLFTNKGLQFSYQKQIDLTLPNQYFLKPQEWRFEKKDIIKFQDKRNYLVNYFLKSLLHQKKMPERKLHASLSNQEQKLLQVDEVGNQIFDKSCFTLQKEVNVNECLRQAQLLLGDIQESMNVLRLKAEKEGNSYPKESELIGLRKIAQELNKITLEGILTQAYEKQNPMIIKEANPALNSKQIYDLMYITVEYHLLAAQFFQLASAMKVLQKGDVQGFGEALCSYGNFDPTIEPEIFLYQSRSGKILWQRQAELLEWEVSNRKKRGGLWVFAMPAGEGKTTTYLPIKFKMLNREEFIAFSISSKPLYIVDREGLKQSCQSFFDFEVAVFEIALSTEACAEDYKRMYEELQRNGLKKGYKLTPEIYYALHLKYQFALEDEDEESVRYLYLLLNFFVHKGVALTDECRQNCSPFSQAKIGIGASCPLPDTDRKVFIDIYRALSSKILTEDKRAVCDVVRLHENLQALMSEEDMLKVKKALLSNMNTWMRKYEQAYESRAKELVNVYFDEFFDKAMKLIGQMQHVRSIKEGEEIHVPARFKQATRAYFDDVYITLIATIQGLLQEGLSMMQTCKLYEELLRCHLEEVKLLDNCSEIEKSVSEWAGKKMRLYQFKSSSIQSISKFYDAIFKSPGAIFWYLEHVLAKDILYTSEQLCVTPIHYLNGFYSNTLFSADYGPQEIYTLFGKNERVRPDNIFKSRVLHQFLEPENKQFIAFSPIKRPLDFFKQIDQYEKIDMVSDGGMLRDFTATEIVYDFFEYLSTNEKADFDGIIFFEEGSTQENDTRLLLQLKGWEKPKELIGHDVPSAVRSLGMGLDWNKLKLFTYIDPSHGTGANIEQKEDTAELVLIREDMDFSQLMQLALRGRGVMKSKQTIIWGASHQLIKKIEIAENASFSVKVLMMWSQKNGVRKENNEVLLSAYQQIDYVIAKPVWDDLIGADGFVELIKNVVPSKLIKIWKKYRSGLVSKIEVDPLVRFKGKKGVRSADSVLLEYAQMRYKLFGYKRPFSWFKNDLASSINMVVRRMPTLAVAQSVDTSRQCYVHSYTREEVKQELITDYKSNLKPEKFTAIPDNLTVDHRDFALNLSKKCYSVQKMFNSNHLTENFFITSNALNTAKSGSSSLGASFLKPIQYILIVRVLGKWSAFGLADKDADHFHKQLCKYEFSTHQVALIGCNRMLVQNGLGKGGFTCEELKEDFIEDVLVDVGLLRCELVCPERFTKRIKTWKDFWPMWEKLKKAQPTSNEVRPHVIEKLVPEEIKKEPIKKKKSLNFFNFL